MDNCLDDSWTLVHTLIMTSRTKSPAASDDLDSLKWDLAEARDRLADAFGEDAVFAAEALVDDAREALRDYETRLDDAREFAAIDAYENNARGDY